MRHAMAVADSALSEMLEMIRAADGGELMRRLLDGMPRNGSLSGC